MFLTVTFKKSIGFDGTDKSHLCKCLMIQIMYSIFDIDGVETKFQVKRFNYVLRERFIIKFQKIVRTLIVTEASTVPSTCLIYKNRLNCLISKYLTPL